MSIDSGTAASKWSGKDTSLLREAHIVQMLAISRATWWRWVNANPELLTPIRLGRNSTRWRASAVQAFVEQAEQRGAKPHGSKGDTSA
ncbi:MAG: AlpA family phage regulatory protein [Hydrogenophaga sp.]|uniref:helix-turn-helix transcriptional regulator n=1 Tax=Hydrogenophaga sp. TaxID=1904254 RepID=UPI002620BEB6|nr:AlpA family phage regulatory protein [Hydrogenophaga sp.]MCW5669385.1 AlpA family phage regulatory protein [Hydrogenophaga sp.]